jgi:hypothetical protein
MRWDVAGHLKGSLGDQRGHSTVSKTTLSRDDVPELAGPREEFEFCYEYLPVRVICVVIAQLVFTIVISKHLLVI